MKSKMSNFLNKIMLAAGIDEAGKGSLISRVYTGIVVLPDNFIDSHSIAS